MQRFAAVILIVVTLATLYPLATCDFTSWDDPHNITSNPHVNPPTLAGLKFHWTHAWASLYIPMTYTIWIALAWVGSIHGQSGAAALNPWVFHIATLLVHVGSALLVLRVLRRLGIESIAACAGALVFAIHPVQVEAVAWVSGLKDVLAGFFCLVSIDQYLSATTERRSALHYAFSIALFVLAMLSKPSAVALPLVLAAIDLVVMRKTVHQTAAPITAFFVLAIPFIVIGRLAQPATLVTPVPTWWRPLVACEALAFYLWKLVWPIKLGIDYGHSPAWLMQNRLAWIASIVPIAIAAALVVWRSQSPLRRWLVAGACVFVASVVPVLGFVPFEFQEKSTVADHYLYLAMFGIAIAVAGAVSSMRMRMLRLALPAIVILSLAMRSWFQTFNWSDSRRLYRSSLSANPRSVLVYNNLCVIALDEQNGSEAESYARKLLEIKPDEPRHLLNLAGALAMQERFAEAETLYWEATLRWPDNLDAHVGRALALLDLGRPRDAQAEYDAAVAIDPASPRVRDLRSRIERALKNPATRS